MGLTGFEMDWKEKREQLLAEAQERKTMQKRQRIERFETMEPFAHVKASLTYNLRPSIVGSAPKIADLSSSMILRRKLLFLQKPHKSTSYWFKSSSNLTTLYISE